MKYIVYVSVTDFSSEKVSKAIEIARTYFPYDFFGVGDKVAYLPRSLGLLDGEVELVSLPSD